MKHSYNMNHIYVNILQLKEKNPCYTEIWSENTNCKYHQLHHTKNCKNICENISFIFFVLMVCIFVHHVYVIIYVGTDMWTRAEIVSEIYIFKLLLKKWRQNFLMITIIMNNIRKTLELSLIYIHIYSVRKVSDLFLRKPGGFNETRLHEATLNFNLHT